MINNISATLSEGYYVNCYLAQNFKHNNDRGHYYCTNSFSGGKQCTEMLHNHALFRKILPTDQPHGNPYTLSEQ